jgi:hypothetical protein
VRERRTYSELSSKAKRLAGALAQRGVDQKTIVVSNVPNTANNLLLQLALSHLGAAVATAKVRCSGLMRALVTFWLSRMRSQRFQRTHTRKTRTVHGEIQDGTALDRLKAGAQPGTKFSSVLTASGSGAELAGKPPWMLARTHVRSVSLSLSLPPSLPPSLLPSSLPLSLSNTRTHRLGRLGSRAAPSRGGHWRGVGHASEW